MLAAAGIAGAVLISVPLLVMVGDDSEDRTERERVSIAADSKGLGGEREAETETLYDERLESSPRTYAPQKSEEGSASGPGSSTVSTPPKSGEPDVEQPVTVVKKAAPGAVLVDQRAGDQQEPDTAAQEPAVPATPETVAKRGLSVPLMTEPVEQEREPMVRVVTVAPTIEPEKHKKAVKAVKAAAAAKAGEDKEEEEKGDEFETLASPSGSPSASPSGAPEEKSEPAVALIPTKKEIKALHDGRGVVPPVRTEETEKQRKPEKSEEEQSRESAELETGRAEAKAPVRTDAPDGSREQEQVQAVEGTTVEKKVVTVYAYRLVSADTGKCLVTTARSVGGELAIAPCGTGEEQYWAFHPDDTIRNGELCMALAGGSIEDGTALRLENCNGSDAQKFRLNATEDLVSLKAGNKCADVWWGKEEDGTPVKLWPCVGTANQTWTRG
ncbi:RICIN domain-containing protein [Streptomyces sp. TRM 70361]|uniref:RICIN domain-containing protein n=1 Tax=Streptomyces sp. TRM 70361 TaxID=3116553 RepID=UPI002E7C0FEF|nr:RICIN domain-containing protein [Streptomyces sp. TRM 70361]MEE1940101.1 RICIN domain-containing protein [Streptomyces sp. TRM 70361]